MRTSSVAVRGLVLALLGLGAGSAFGQNVTAFNPYDGAGLGGRPAPNAPGRSAVSIDQPPPSGPAFNPWNPSGVQAGYTAMPQAGVTAMPRGQQPQAASADGYGVPYYDRGSSLPAPPPDAMRSRVVAIPQKGQPSAPRSGYAPPASGSGRPVPLARESAPTPPPVAEPTPPAAAAPPTPTPVRPAEPPASAPAMASTTSPAQPPVTTQAAPPRTAAVAPTPTEPEPPPPAPTPPSATVLFATDSAEINDAAKAELDRIAKAASTHGVRQIELRAYAGGSDLIESRKVALARALAVRSYLIDQGVKARIEVGTFGPAQKGMGPAERVDLAAPGI
jgi:outer membrane protein OmpA-like peptidoglycan-associated protein